jgi:hypothetical protein
MLIDSRSFAPLFSIIQGLFGNPQYQVWNLGRFSLVSEEIQVYSLVLLVHMVYHGGGNDHSFRELLQFLRKLQDYSGARTRRRKLSPAISIRYRICDGDFLQIKFNGLVVFHCFSFDIMISSAVPLNRRKRVSFFLARMHEYILTKFKRDLLHIKIMRWRKQNGNYRRLCNSGSRTGMTDDITQRWPSILRCLTNQGMPKMQEYHPVIQKICFTSALSSFVCMTRLQLVAARAEGEL